MVHQRKWDIVVIEVMNIGLRTTSKTVSEVCHQWTSPFILLHSNSNSSSKKILISRVDDILLIQRNPQDKLVWATKNHSPEWGNDTNTSSWLKQDLDLTIWLAAEEKELEVLQPGRSSTTFSTRLSLSSHVISFNSRSSSTRGRTTTSKVPISNMLLRTTIYLQEILLSTHYHHNAYTSM